MRISKLSLFMVWTMACQSNEWTPTFGGGGSQQNGGSGGSGGSTWIDEDSAWGETDTEYAPTITDFRAAFEYYPTIGWVLEATISYQDQDGDLSGGIVYLALEEEGGNEFEQEVPIDGQSAYIEDGNVSFAIDQVDTDRGYSLEVSVEDSSGNLSDIAQTVVEPN